MEPSSAMSPLMRGISLDKDRTWLPRIPRGGSLYCQRPSPIPREQLFPSFVLPFVVVFLGLLIPFCGSAPTRGPGRLPDGGRADTDTNQEPPY